MKKIKIIIWLGLFATLVLLIWPAASWLQARDYAARPDGSYDALYLVCGARAQSRRVEALANWLTTRQGIGKAPPLVLIGRDPQKSCWCRQHQTNHTVTAWAVERIETALPEFVPQPDIKIVPGSFSNTDGEMQALALYLRDHPEIRRVALVTSRYHARRALLRLRANAPPETDIAVIPGVVRWNNRNPATVLLEYLKILRDAAGLSHTPLISRKPAAKCCL